MGHIELQRITKRFDNGHEALTDVSIEFSEGSMTFLTGHSGAGKSTFLKMLLRADVPTRGSPVSASRTMPVMAISLGSVVLED